MEHNSQNFIYNKKAIQWDAYGPLVDRFPAQVEGCLPRGGVCPGAGVSAQDGVSQHAMEQTSPCGQTDTCESITFANFFAGGKNILYQYTCEFLFFSGKCSFCQIHGDLLVSTAIFLIQKYRYLGVQNDYQTAYLDRKICLLLSLPVSQFM